MKEEKIKVGDQVKIVNPGSVYSTYERMANSMGLNNYIHGNSEFPSNGKGTVVAIEEHEDKSEGLLIGIKMNLNMIIGADGIEKINKEVKRENNENKKLICLQGIPASGKTTWANKFVSENKGWARVNKDDIRKNFGITYEKFDKNLEKEVIRAERELVISLISSGYNVIVDNTHLYNKKGGKNKHIDYYRELAKEAGYAFEIKVFHIETQEAIKRDQAREEPVGEAVFKKMAKYAKFPNKFPDNPNFIPVDENKKNCFIFDIDGTLAFMDGQRSPYDGSKVGLDRLNTRLKYLMDWIRMSDDEVIIVTGRSADYQEETLEWLKEKGIKWDRFFMRDSGDTRCDTVIKKEIWENELKDEYNIMGVFDDRNRVVDMWRENGIPVYQCWYGDF